MVEEQANVIEIEGLVKRANKGDLVPNPYAAEW